MYLNLPICVQPVARNGSEADLQHFLFERSHRACRGSIWEYLSCHWIRGSQITTLPSKGEWFGLVQHSDAWRKNDWAGKLFCFWVFYSIFIKAWSAEILPSRSFWELKPLFFPPWSFFFLFVPIVKGKAECWIQTPRKKRPDELMLICFPYRVTLLLMRTFSASRLLWMLNLFSLLPHVSVQATLCYHGDRLRYFWHIVLLFQVTSSWSHGCHSQGSLSTLHPTENNFLCSNTRPWSMLQYSCTVQIPCKIYACVATCFQSIIFQMCLYVGWAFYFP